MKRRNNSPESIFERLLWGARLLVIVPVIACVLMALGTLYLRLAYVYRFAGLLFAPGAAGRNEALAVIVKAVDVFLVSAVLIVVAFGLYELFVGKIGVAERSEVASRLLKIETLEELKERIAKLLVVILAVEFFQRALSLRYGSARDILYLAAAILLVSGALYLIGRKTG